ncbi:hypothetical protein FOMG_19377 [Fusarium oxysporum f. sp. melonis 26406]|uniref:Uncharacterized protein n=1 Tax=Fusarium oxysporum f. sp. melonis 26406 TaxID=1089452 RepID=W9Z6H5_FUSOX|nr:hypothetical protein FOMG_19377 [Fusarium oxysporum f. sp. melonis 26406]
MPDKAPAEFHRRHNHATLTTTGASAAGNGTTILGDAQKGRMRTLQREERKITCRENGADERTSTMATAKATMMGQAGVRLNPPEQLALHTMPRYDGAGFTHVEADYSKPWLPSESRPEATPGEEAPTHRRMMNATACATNKNEPKSEYDQDQRSTGVHAGTLQRTTGTGTQR